MNETGEQTMYDDLVKSLRQCAEASCAGCKNDLVEIGCRGLLQREAADVIEELSDYVRQIEELRKDGYYLQKTKMMTYGQATMTMPLPKPPFPEPPQAEEVVNDAERC